MRADGTTCPPCTGNCRQGRDCGARPSPATVAMWAVIAVSSLVIVVGVASALGVFMPHIHL